MDTTRRRASSGSPYENTVGFSRAVRVGQHIAVAGTAPIFGDIRPASTMVLIAGLLDSRWTMEVELDAIVTDRPGG